MISHSAESSSAVDATWESEEKLKREVAAARETGKPVLAKLRTDERVFARITDGIYREPASALRELIANAYDADATDVRIETDAPRFSKIIVRDNGRGLSEEALVHVMCHIGGSLKRTREGAEYGVVADGDTTLSKGGRKLIGKLGIGLFSVSQLTHHLIIVTKVRGENFRRICDILLRPQQDEFPEGASDEEGFVTGEAQITTVHADDTDTQGTEITLLDIRPFVRESLQSIARWEGIALQQRISDSADESDNDEVDFSDDDVEDDEFRHRYKVPTYHIGEVSRENEETLILPAELPWSAEDDPSSKFEKLVSSVHGLGADSTASEKKIELEEVLDSYLSMIWTLSLSIPITYAKKHPFDLSMDDGIGFYALSNRSGGRAEPIVLGEDETIRTKLGLTSGTELPSLPFSVTIDGVQLYRPILYPAPSFSSNVSERPLMFYGKLRTDLSAIAEEYRGGSLEFEAYLSWKPRVVPVEHNGVMIRINGASGILFDEFFLGYKIAELTRLRQVTAEIFVKKGLDAALNIDRESFNVAHPHYQYISKWLHHALKQLMSRHKNLQQGKSISRLENRKEEAFAELKTIVDRNEENSPAVTLREVVFSSPAKSGQLEITAQDSIVFERTSVFSSRAIKPITRSDKLREALFEEKIKAVAALLDKYGLLERLEPKDQTNLLKSIVDVFSVELKK